MKKAFVEAVKDKAEERTKALTAEKQKAEAERDRALVQSRSLAIERDRWYDNFRNKRTASGSTSAKR